MHACTHVPDTRPPESGRGTGRLVLEAVRVQPPDGCLVPRPGGPWGGCGAVSALGRAPGVEIPESCQPPVAKRRVGSTKGI